MNRSYWKIVFRSIKGSLVRFIAILSIIALGVGFFSGLKVTMPSFMRTGDKFISDYQLYDYRLISTIGFDEEDISKIREIEGFRSVQGAYFVDAVVSYDDSLGTDEIRFHSLTDGINIPNVVSGRMPQAPDEVVVDEYIFGTKLVGQDMIVGDVEGLAYERYKVVGAVRSPYYLNFQRGTTDIGDGSLTAYVYLPEEGFDFEYYTEAYIKLDSDIEAYSDEYEDNVDSREDEIETKVLTILENRFDDMISDSKEEYQDAMDALDDFSKEADEEFDDAQKELDDAKIELEDAQKKLEDAQVELDDAQTKLDDADTELDEARLTLNAYEEKIAEAQDTFDEKKKELDAAGEQIDQAVALLPEMYKGRDDIYNAMSQLVSKREEVSEQKDAYKLALDAQAPGFTEDEYMLLVYALIEIDSTYNDLAPQYEELNTKIAEIEAAKKEYDEGLKQYNDAYDEFLEQKKEYDSYVKKYNDGLTELNNGLKEYDEGKEEFEDGKIEYEDGLKEYEDGVKELASKRLEVAIVKGSLKQFTGRNIDRIETLDDPEIVVLKRDTNVGYVCFENDAKIVDGVAAVFPLFFFAIAALVVSTTMQRMVADERNQIGTMRAMGYSKMAIIMKYVIYSGSAAVIGAVGGFMGGSKLFPYVIWKVYAMMYGFAPITFATDYIIFALSLLVSLICSVGVTIFTCIGEFTEEPAELVRPKAPRAGKRILLERIDFIWSRLKFLHKVSARNVFRFKKRMWMMIIGIAGCTALVLTGFGLKDSIDNLVNFQYDEIQTYDLSVKFKDDTKREKMDKLIAEADEKVGMEMKTVYVDMSNIKHVSKTGIRDVIMIACDDPSVTEFFNPHNEGVTYGWPSDGKAAISSKLANDNKLKAGDKIKLEYGDEGKTGTIEIEYVFENYINHYVLVNASTYEQFYGEDFEPKSALVKTPDDVTDSTYAYQYSTALSKSDDVLSCDVVDQSRANFEETMEQLNYVVILVIFCAALLAFIVLFNLNNINITERVREIATLKVLGFNKRETGSYVFRENSILVFLGFIVGVPLGIALHSFVIGQIKMDMVTYKILILPMSYVYSLLMVFLFSITVDLVMRRKINKIDMAESLKSIE
ncbi:MAG: FtsX-like permease family protein [Clostridiales bacterium]|nr:FtsX-like permease family protein [Clostridiales bacterium]